MHYSRRSSSSKQNTAAIGLLLGPPAGTF